MIGLHNIRGFSAESSLKRQPKCYVYWANAERYTLIVTRSGDQ